jgi:catechol 2,3-dioxygenase-like lactoylglutathione lyase family enzyme
MISKRIAYVALASNNVDQTCMLLGECLGLPRNDLSRGTGAEKIPVFTIGQSALAVVPVGDPLVAGEEKAGVHHVALTVEDIDKTAKSLASLGLGNVARPEARGLGGKRTLSLDPAYTCGLRTMLMEPLELRPHIAGMLERIDHIGVASEDVAAAESVFSRKLGLEVESRQTDMEVSMAVESFTSDKYGVVYHSRNPEPVGGLRVTFITLGDCELEFLANFNPQQSGAFGNGGPGTTRQDQGAIARYVASRGQGLHHVAVKSPDINGTLAHLDRAGFQLVDKVGRPGSRRAQIGFIHPKATGGILFHVVQRE